MHDVPYIRFQGTVRHPRGHFPGVFVLTNELAREGRLAEEQYRFWRANNDWYDAHYINPTHVDPRIYDREIHPGAVAWFKSSAHDLIKRVDGYLKILAAHGVDCRHLESSSPGRIIYEDACQVVVMRHEETNGPTP